MRIIAGKYRGRRLQSPPTLETRPTSDRLREALFNILAPRLHGARFLDLCAGSGAVGIEALSRGARHATFVDQSRRTCALIETNLNDLGVAEEEREVVCVEASLSLGRLGRKNAGAFDIIFFDPPYDSDYEVVLGHPAIGDGSILSADAIVVVEHRKQKELKDELGGLHCYRRLKQGDSSLGFYQAT